MAFIDNQFSEGLYAYYAFYKSLNKNYSPIRFFVDQLPVGFGVCVFIQKCTLHPVFGSISFFFEILV